MQLDLLQHVDEATVSQPSRRPRAVAPRIRYIGSKARVSDALLDLIGPPRTPGERFVDLFCGGGSVSKAAAARGWSVHTNDHLVSSVIIARAQLLSAKQLSFDRAGGYERVIKLLNTAAPENGPIFREYSPSGLSRAGEIRKYFTETNAQKIDGVRAAIENQFRSGRFGEHERTLLIADLMCAANSVANIAGTYGCFLSRWTAPALSEFRMVPREIPRELPPSTLSVLDAFEFCDERADTLYCDPPYTKRQYAAYYHLLETIALGDDPYVVGISGIRPWEHKASPFCYRRRALHAFEDLLNTKRARRVFISYSSEGHVKLEQLVAALGRFGSLQVHNLQTVRRYAPNEVSRQGPKEVREFLLQLDR
ncbi:MAG TPA: DNA adenine methylase [Stellaceae bacterium]|nr:DNA adenine methylase [Stellaceae bacterium]